MQTNMEDEEDVLFEGILYKLKVAKSKTLRLHPERWKSKYFVLCFREKLVLKCFKRKPKSLKISSRQPEMVLFPSFKIEKLTNVGGRPFAVQITSSGHHLCLSADEQMTIDILAFLLQSQMLLHDSIKDGLISVQPQASEVFQRLGAKGVKCWLHVSPWGLSLVLQKSRCVLAQWPLKSIRFYESSGTGVFTIEAGKVAPMGEGVYVFHTQPGADNCICSTVDNFIIGTLDRVKPNQRGTSEEIEDYIRELDCLHSLTYLSPSCFASSEVRKILQDNWNYISPSAGVNRSASGSVSDDASSVSQLSSVNTQHPPLNRLVSDNSSRPLPSPHASRSVTEDSGSQRVRDRPPPLSPQRGNLMGSAKIVKSSPLAVRMDSVFEGPQSPEAEAQDHLKVMDVTIRTKEGTVSRSVDNRQMSQDSTSTTTTSEYFSLNQWPSSHQAPFSSEAVLERQSHPVVLPNEHTKIEESVEEWLVSASCEDLSDHMRTVIFKPQNSSRSQSDKSSANTDTKDNSAGANSSPKSTPPPFVNIQQYRSSVEWGKDKARDRSHSFDVKSKSSDDPLRHANAGELGHKPSVRQIRKLVAARSVAKENLQKSLSNPGFLNLGSKEQLYHHRVQPSKTSSPNKDGAKLSHRSKVNSRSLASLLPGPLRRYISKESISRPSSSSPSPNLRQRSRDSSNDRSNFQRFDSARSLKEMTIKGIHFTEQSRSFRKPKSSAARGVRATSGDSASHAASEQEEQAAASENSLPQLASLHSMTENAQNMSETEKSVVACGDISQPQSQSSSSLEKQEFPMRNGLGRLSGNVLQSFVPSHSTNESF